MPLDSVERFVVASSRGKLSLFVIERQPKSQARFDQLGFAAAMRAARFKFSNCSILPRVFNSRLAGRSRSRREPAANFAKLVQPRKLAPMEN